MKAEDKFYLARNSEFDTDDVKNILHKETKDAEYGIDKERHRIGIRFNAYFAWIGERILSARFKTREDAQRWIDRQIARGHPNKRFSRPGQPEKFLRIDPQSIRRWESATRQKIDSVGPTVWIFVDPSGKEIWLPAPMRFREAVGWLNANQRGAKPNDYYKVAMSRPGQPERFDRYGYEKMDYDRLMRESFDLRRMVVWTVGPQNPELRQKITALQQEFARRGFTEAATLLNGFLRKSFSRPGQPERFAAPSPKEQQQIRAASRPPASAIAQLKRVVAEYKKRADKGERLDSDDYWGLKAVLDAAISGDRSGLMSRARGLDTIIREEIPQAVWHWAGGEVLRWSKPGQPEKFDASSLDRGSFAEASTSPMLGKLLAAKVMPEGGWRAVQAGSDTLVISFEDADLARDFGRRVATKGYNATSPVQAIGRYWNVEVKNG